MYHNGYVMVDCKKLNLLAQASQTVDGIFDSVEDAVNSGKPIVAVNCEYGTGVSVTPINVFAIKEASNYILTASILQVIVTPEDGVTIRSLVT